MKINSIIAAATVALVPAIAFAAPTDVAGQNVKDLFKVFGDLANLSIGILVTLALAVFFYGLVRYIFKLGGEEGAKNGKDLMIYGIVALFIMVSIWGIISFVGSFLNINQNQGQGVGNLLPNGGVPTAGGINPPANR